MSDKKSKPASKLDLTLTLEGTVFCVFFALATLSLVYYVSVITATL